MNFILYTAAGAEAGTIEAPSLFEVASNSKLIHRYVTWVRTMLRSTIAHTKTRGDVRGGGKKPWRQKGTGRARVGSSRNPLWRHGGTAFGPRNDQTYATRMPRQERRKALFSSFGAKAESDNVRVLDAIVMDAPKTKGMIALVGAVPGLQGRKILFIAASGEDTARLSGRNLPKFTSTTPEQLNVLDVMNADVLLFSADGLAALESHFTTVV